MIQIETITELAHHRYTVSVFCHKCGRRGPNLDLQKYIARGQGNIRPIALGLRHANCQTVLQLTIHPEPRYGKK
jgi:hypothetical protein